MNRPSLSVVIVSYESVPDLRRSLPPLVAQLSSEDELIVVDNAQDAQLADALDELAPSARLINAGGNVGFAAGANLGAAAASGELLLLLNPDAVAQPGFVEAITAPWRDGWAAWMGLVTMDSGTAINTSGGVLHFTGIGWAGQAHQPLMAAPRDPAEVGFLSGACLAVPRRTWLELGGFPEPYFMYCEDVDLSLRLRLRGGRLGVAPSARVDHSYSFDKGASKWRHLERNRWATVLRTYPAGLLALVLPALLMAELAIWAAAVRGGWAPMKARATLDLARSLPGILRARIAIQRGRRVSAAAFAAALTDELSSPYLGGVAERRWVSALLRAYWRLVLGLLGAGGAH
jgi:GT2 family glycosyltransferase